MNRELFGGHNKSLNLHTTSFRDFAAFHIVDKIVQSTVGGGPGPVLSVPPPPPLAVHSDDTHDLPIGIIGAGASGLYAAMILQDLGIKYEILESRDRVGGRVYTHRFNGEAGFNAPINTRERYDYFDVGAMRFPRIPFSDRVFDLFEKRLNMQDILIEYRLQADNTFQYYNTRPPLRAGGEIFATEDDYFHVSQKNAGTIPDRYMTKGASDWAETVYKYYKDLFGEIDGLPPAQRGRAFQKAWEALTKADHYSTRGYMLSVAREPLDSPGQPSPDRPFPPAVVDWVETFDSGTGLYDEAFVESVMDSLDFGWPQKGNPRRKPAHPHGKSVSSRGFASTHQDNHTHIATNPTPGPRSDASEWEWVCIDGGSDHITHRMEETLKTKPILNQRVQKMALTPKKDAITVELAGGEVKKYSQVISTTPLGCLSTIDTDGLNLLYNQKVAIRSLQYDSATKVGIKFAKRWWEDPAVMGEEKTIQGGQSTSDTFIRTCVYPSNGLNCPNPPGVLIASYTWAQDARRMGSLAQGNGTRGDKILLDLTLNDLAKMHGISVAQMGEVVDHFAHSWFNDENALGAYALFGPAQFGNPNSDIPSPFVGIKAPAAHGRFHIAGEATSAHHGWVLGASNSAWRAVYNALIGHKDKQELLIKRWGIPDEENIQNLHKLCAMAHSRML